MAYSKEEAAGLIIRAGKLLVEKGLTARTWGNISARISETEFMITPSGKAYENLTEEDLVICRISDLSYEGDTKPSSEKGVHAAAYKYRPEINFVIHTHQLYATAVGAMGKGISGPLVKSCKDLGDEVTCARYAISSTKILAANVEYKIRKYPKCNAFFMRYHGVLCLGIDDKEAFAAAFSLEDICKKIVERKLHFDIAPKEGFPEELDKEAILAEIAKVTEDKAILFDSSEAAVEVSWKWSKMYAMIDDMAQIGGYSFACLEKTEDLPKRIAQELEKAPCVFIRGLGAVLRAPDQDEAEAFRTVLDKNCVAALYCDARGVREHLRRPDAGLQRAVYKNKYSKLK